MLKDGFLRFCDDPELACCRAEAELGQLRIENARLRDLTTHLGACEDCHTAHECLVDSLRTQLAESQRRERAAEKCIYDVETYLEFGSAPYIMKTIANWKRGLEAGEGGTE